MQTKEYQILWPDEKHFYFLIWFFHPSKEFDTLSEDDHLSNHTMHEIENSNSKVDNPSEISQQKEDIDLANL